MRLLFLSNYYPPHGNGGYEQLCQEVAAEFTSRGHEVMILTSRSPEGTTRTFDGTVETQRRLHLEVEAGLARTTWRLLLERTRLERENFDNLHKVVNTFRPDTALVWGMWNVPRSVPAMLEQLLPDRVAYYLCDYWPSLPSAYLQQWQTSATRGIARWPKRILAQLTMAKLARERQESLRLEGPICVSRAVRRLLVEADVPVAHARVIYNGIRLSAFQPIAASRWQNRAGEGLRLLYAGRLSPEKGIPTAIRALSRLDTGIEQSTTLDIVGSGDIAYERALRALVKGLQLTDRVFLRGNTPRPEMPRLMGQYDVLLFPSEWEEPLARIIMEAMAVGLVVIGTTTGGTGELLQDGVTGLTFLPRDDVSLSCQIRRLLGAPILGQTITSMARQRVEEQFTLERMAGELEAALHTMVSNVTTGSHSLGRTLH